MKANTADDKLPLNRVLITGGAGFIGSHLVEHFQERAEVRVLDDLSSGSLDNLAGFQYQLFKGSVLDRELVRAAVQGVDCVFHLAAVVSVPVSLEAPVGCAQVNSIGTLTLLEEAARAKAGKLVFSSSAAIYGDNPLTPKVESMPPEPLSPYAITKLDGEFYCDLFTRTGRLPTVCLRYFNVFGPRQNPRSQYAAAIPAFIERAARGEPITIHGDGEQTRDFVYVKDVVAANLHVASRPDCAGVFNVAGGRRIAIKQLAALVCRELNSTSPIVHAAGRPGDVKHSLAGLDKLRATGFSPATALEANLRQTILSYQGRDALPNGVSRIAALPISKINKTPRRPVSETFRAARLPNPGRPMRFLFYSHDGMGLGHTRRHLAVAEALTELSPESTILLVTGAQGVSRLGLPRNVEILKLPSLRKVANGEYSSRSLGVSADDIRELRSRLLLAAVKSFQPTVVLVDKHPFGAGGEFKAGLKALRQQGGRAALGLRDILDEPSQVLKEWRPYRMQQRIARFYDQVFIYGQRAILDSIQAYEFPAALADRTRFCGYVVNRESPEEVVDFQNLLPDPAADPRPVVLATAGGGEDGFAMLENFMHAAAGAPWHGLVVAGPMTPEPQMQTLTRLAAQNGVTLRMFVPHLPALFKSVSALVSMGGYNTIAEAVSQGVPTVCVPRIVPRTEQLIRADAFARLGLLQSVHPTGLNPQVLSAAIHRAISTPRNQLLRRAQQELCFDGARQAASHLVQLATLINLGDLAAA